MVMSVDEFDLAVERVTENNKLLNHLANSDKAYQYMEFYVFSKALMLELRKELFEKEDNDG
jgi:hypothetical protein